MKEFTFTVNEQELNIISNALVDQPFKVSAQVINKLQKQINEQESKTQQEEEPKGE